ncbi:MAG: PD-(D/E)XK nuclease family protein [Dehalococcoidia bacterium]
MTVQRHFLGWDAPVTTRVQQFLLPSQLSGPVDLENQLVVVPTRQADRRLREALALYCADQNTALLSPRVVTPAFFLQSDQQSARVANQTEVTAVWIDVLMKADLSQYGHFFPARPADKSFTWAMHTGDLLQRLRDTLADAGQQIADISGEFGSILEEQERWDDMAGLEAAYLGRLEELGLQDPCETMIRRAEDPELPEGIERIVVAAVPDPTPLTIRALERLASRVAIDLLVHAPESLADCFDEWGRPITDRWSESQIPIPGAESNLILTGSPSGQSRKVVEIMAEETSRFGPADVAIGVPNSDITPVLMADLAEKDLLAFDPAGKGLAEHPLYRLLESFHALITEKTYAAFSAFLRHADVLTFLQQKYDLSPRWLLEELDTFQNQQLPLGMEDMAYHLLLRPARPDGRRPFRSLAKAVAFVDQQVQQFASGDIDSAVRSLLQTIYEVRTLNPGGPEDDDFIAASGLVDSALRDLTGDVIGRLDIEKGDAFGILLKRLTAQRYYLERKGAIIDLEGWLELPWNSARLLIVTGMNEGSVPEGHLSDVFLPDTLRRQLNLRSDADRLARDAYLMQALIESRHQDGRVCFLVSKTGASRDPLKPSRLLFRCGDAELVQRARKLFGDPGDQQQSYPPAISFRLQAGPPADVRAEKITPGRLSVTAFRDYLQCPFRFYLKHILGMEELNDEKAEMDALDFGSLVHDVLATMAGNDEMKMCQEHVKLGEFLCSEARNWAAARFGHPLPLQIRIQLDAARQRLRAAARVQADLARDGWQIIDSEVRAQAELAGMRIGGRIDRIDRHAATGRIRILDYKTSDNAQQPEEAHLGSPRDEVAGYMLVEVNGRQKRWTDLQLPLYRMLLSGDDFAGSEIELGYFNLPRATDDTGVSVWKGLSDGIMASARTCAGHIVADIRDRRFWPPVERVQYDDFESLFPGAVPDCIDVAALEAFMRGETQ